MACSFGLTMPSCKESKHNILALVVVGKANKFWVFFYHGTNVGTGSTKALLWVVLKNHKYSVTLKVQI
jgi:hypothetical protein